MKFTLSLIILFSVVRSHAAITEEECPSVDYSEQMGPNRNQANVGWCWAFADADLIGFFQKTGSKVSAMDVALNALGMSSNEYSQALLKSSGSWRDVQIWHNERLETQRKYDRYNDASAWMAIASRGNARAGINGAVAYNLKNRICLESEVPSEGPLAFKPYVKGANVFGTPFVSFIKQRLADLGDQSIDEPTSGNSLEFLLSHPLESSSLTYDAPGLIGQQNQQILQKVRSSVAALCKTGPAPKPMKMELEFVARSVMETDVASTNAAAWLREGSPIEVDINALYLLDEKFDKSQPMIPNHTTLLAGMRWNSQTKSCDFKLRNSWGSSCAGYPKRFDGRCESGNFWLTSEELESITVFESRIRGK